MPFWSQNCSMKWEVSLKDWYIPLCPANMCVHMQPVSFPSQFSHALNSCIFLIIHVFQRWSFMWLRSPCHTPGALLPLAILPALSPAGPPGTEESKVALCVQLHERCKFWYFPQCVVSRLLSRCHCATERKAMAEDEGVIVKDWSSVFCIIVSKLQRITMGVLRLCTMKVLTSL